MEYKMNPDEICNIFAVPVSVVDEDLRLAGSAQLKVLLWTLRHAKHENATVEELAEELGMDRADVVDAMQFWLDRQVIVKTGEAPKPVQKPEQKRVKPAPLPKKEPAPVVVVEPEPEKEEKPAVSELPMSRPSHEQLAIRCRESKELCDLFAEVQKSLGKTIGYEAQSVLLMMYDTYGLPMPVILMAVEYAVSRGKPNINYIAGVGKNWCEMEIDTLDKALEYIERMNGVDNAWSRFCELTGIKIPKLTEKQRKLFATWTKEYGYSVDMIYLAYEEMADYTGKFSLAYLDKIIRNWYAQGIKTAAEVEKNKADFANASSAKRKVTPASSSASYDLEEHDRKAKTTAPVYKRKVGNAD